jgi:hypothetical protein
MECFFRFDAYQWNCNFAGMIACPTLGVNCCNYLGLSNLNHCKRAIDQKRCSLPCASGEWKVIFWRPRLFPPRAEHRRNPHRGGTRTAAASVTVLLTPYRVTPSTIITTTMPQRKGLPIHDFARVGLHSFFTTTRAARQSPPPAGGQRPPSR